MTGAALAHRRGFARAGYPVRTARRRQEGIAILAAVALLALAIGAGLVAFLSEIARETQRQKNTARVLALAKEALIGYAAGVDLAAGASRPGDLPCPDLTNDGIAESSCGNAAGTTGQANRLGRLPWRTLGLEDLRDASGERLWYAVSNNFKNNTRTTCVAAGDPGCLNSDARGTITVRLADGTIVHDGTNPNPFVPSGAIALVLAPGSVLQRQGAAALQDRSGAGVNGAVNYLDLGNGEDNAVFADSATDGFLNGPVYDAGGAILVNDRVLAITYDDLMPLLERRGGGEVAQCLTAYAAQSQNNGRYPWATAMGASAAGDYSDAVNARFGRIPDGPLDDTSGGTFGALFAAAVCPFLPATCMEANWPGPPNCAITSGTWWLNWKDQVLYGVATQYQPIWPTTPPAACGGACLSINPPSAAADKQFVVIVAGRRLSGVAGGQPRATVAEKSTAANYVEGENDWVTTPSDTFTQQPVGAALNDRLRFR